MLIGYHGSGLFGEARKIMNDTAHTLCLKDTVTLSYQINILSLSKHCFWTYHCSSQVTQFSCVTLISMNLLPKNFTYFYFRTVLLNQEIALQRKWKRPQAKLNAMLKPLNVHISLNLSNHATDPSVSQPQPQSPYEELTKI